MKAIRLTFILALALLLAVPAFARDWYVSAVGTGDGLTSGSPTQDLAAVLNAVAANDAIYLNGGDGFGFAGNSLTANVTLTIQSYGTGQGIVSNTTTPVNGQLLNLTSGASGTTFDNIELRYNDLNLGAQGYRTIYLGSLVSNITIKNCTFRHFDWPGGHWNGNAFIVMHNSAHTNMTIINSLFRDLRYSGGAGYDYRHPTITAMGCVPLRLINNTVSNYEGFVSFQGGPFNRDVMVLSNKLYRCYGAINWQKFEGGTAGGLVKVGYQGLAGGEFAWNIIYNGFPDMTNSTRYAAFMLDRGFNDGKIHNNTFYGLGAACLINSGAEIVQTLDWYNNILIACNANAQTGFWSVVNGIGSGIVYSNIWDPFQAFTNQFYGTSTVFIASNPLLDPLFASLDPGNSTFLRPTVAAAVHGYEDGFIGAVNPVPEPLLLGCCLGAVALLRGRRR